MPNMKKNFLKIAGILSVGVITLNSCGDKTEPPLVYFPDMYFPVAYDPLMKAQDRIQIARTKFRHLHPETDKLD